MTPEQTEAYNRQTAIRIVRERLGLASLAPVDWTYDQRVQYNRELAIYITENAHAFDDAEIQVARDIAQQPIDQLSDTGFAASLGAFGSAFLDEAAALNQDLNPFSEKNRRLVWWLAIAGAAIYFLGPTVANLVKTVRTK